MRKSFRFGNVVWLAAALVAVLALGGVQAFGQSEEKQKDVQAEEKQKDVEPLKQIENPQADFRVEIWVDKENATYKPEEGIVFSFKSTRDCHLTLFDVGTSGKVQIPFSRTSSIKRTP